MTISWGRIGRGGWASLGIPDGIFLVDLKVAGDGRIDGFVATIMHSASRLNFTDDEIIEALDKAGRHSLAVSLGKAFDRGRRD